MTATNHGLSGALIGLTITQPIIALPLALISHFVLDALPHFGFKNYEERKRHIKIFNFYVKADFILPVSVVLVLAIVGAGWLIIACALVAISPDLMWLYRFVFVEKLGKNPLPQNSGPIPKFHKNIQRYESMGGIWIELAFSILMIGLLAFSWQ